MHRVLVLVSLLLSQDPLNGSAHDPSLIVRRAVHAVEGDSSASLRTEWTGQLGREPVNREAVLGLATLARLTYDYPAAEDWYGRLTGGTGPPDRLILYARLGQAAAAVGQGEFRRGDSLFRFAVEGAKALGDSAAEAEGFMGLAVTRSRLDGPRAALALLQDVAALIPVTERGLAAGLRCRKAMLLATLLSPEAEPEARSGIAAAERAGDFGARGLCLHALARNFERNEPDSAIVALGRAANDLRRIHDRARLSAVLQGRGYLLISLGEYGRALGDLRAALEEAHASSNLPVIAWASINLAQLFAPFGDLATAADHATRAESLLTQQHDEFGLFVLRGVQGLIAEKAGNTAEARRVFLRAAREAPRFAPHLEFLYRRKLAGLAILEGNWIEARKELDTARAGYRRLSMTPWDRYLEYFYGSLALAEGDPARAQRHFETHLRGLGPEQRGRHYLTAARLAEVLVIQGRVRQGEEALNTATDTLDAWRASLSDRELRLLSFEMRQEDLDPDLGTATVVAALVAERRLDGAFHLAERRRARELLDRLVEREALQVPASARASPTRTSIEPAVLPSDVIAALPDDSTGFLTFVTGRQSAPVTAFMLTKGGIRAVILSAAGAFSAEISRLQAVIESGHDLPGPARRLGRMLLDSTVALLPPGVVRLVIVPDGELNRVPFEALTLADGQPAGARFAISQVPSAAIAIRLWHRPQNRRPIHLLAMGDPRFDRIATAPTSEAAVFQKAFDATGGLPRLPGSAREVLLVARFAPQAEVRLREEASEARLKQTSLSSFSVLHFATHAVVDDRALTRTALALTPTGLEDGFVSPAELAGLHLEADLVVLSGCRTAGGVLLGSEGIQGLTAPLIEAGARAVLAARWPVGDRSTIRFIKDFYRGMAAGAPAAEALRLARVAAIDRGASVREWASFTLVGDPMVRLALRPPATLWLWGVAASGLAVLGLLAWMIRGTHGLKRNSVSSERSSPPLESSARTHQ